MRISEAARRAAEDIDKLPLRTWGRESRVLRPKDAVWDLAPVAERIQAAIENELDRFVEGYGSAHQAKIAELVELLREAQSGLAAFTGDATRQTQERIAAVVAKYVHEEENR